MSKKLYKTTIVIYSDEDPGNMELTHIAEAATDGLSICESQVTTTVPHSHVPSGVRSFFSLDDDD